VSATRSQSYSDVIRRTWEEDLLFSALIELTYRCNLDCYFCYNDLGLRGTPLSKEQYFELFADLRDLEVLHLILSGGEPLAHPHFFALGARGRELGFAVRVKTNGHALRGELARRLRDEVDPFLLEVSLHGACAATHDRQTRVAGSFVRLLANLEEALALGLRIKLNSTLTGWNEGEMEGMFGLADRLGVPLQVDPEVTPKDDGDTEPLSITASRDGVRRLFALQRQRAAERAAAGLAGGPAEVVREGDQGLPAPPPSRHCGAGSSAVAVDPYGNVYPCVQWRRPLGNLHRLSIRDIWRRSPALAEVRRANQAARDVVAAEGPEGRWMGFCPGLAVARTGAADGLYDGARSRLELAREPLAEDRQRALLPVVS
jgi:AdoMet-dependent heme synthase